MKRPNRLMAAVHPGDILREDFMKPLGLTVNKLALELHVPATRIGEIVHGRRRVTAEAALRLARYFHTNAEFWLNLQNFYDIEVSRRSGRTAEIEHQVQPVGKMMAYPSLGRDHFCIRYRHKFLERLPKPLHGVRRADHTVNSRLH